MPGMYLYTTKNIMAMNAKLTGFHTIPDGLVRLQGMQGSK
jgi:hypothetical protein